jgi:predicted Rossmann-fold nucleotide-binding protein
MAGGVGTLSEVALAWNLLQTAELGPRPLVLLGPRWRALLPVLREQLVIDDRDMELVTLADDPESAVAAVAASLGPAV